MAEAAGSEKKKTGKSGAAAHRPVRKGNQRPKLFAPTLQTMFSLPSEVLLSRLWRRIMQPVYGSRLYSLTLGSRSAGELQAGGDEATLGWPGDAQVGLQILTGEFRFAGEAIRQPTPLSDPIGASEGWRYVLNTFPWINDLRDCGGPSARQLAKHLIQRWVEENESYDPFTWRADILSARLRTLLLNHGYLEVNSDALFRSTLLRSLNRQATHLARALPDGLAGAALLKAIVALMLAGLMLPRGEAFLARGRQLFAVELPKQMLADGGHVERSPQVMLELLQHLVDLRDVLALARQPMPDSLQMAIDNLASVVVMLRHGDGTLASFNDTPELQPAFLDSTLKRATERLRPLNQLPITGFQRLDRGKTSVIVDCGAPARHGFDDHAHAGTLSFELCYDGERMIVNCGAHPWSKEWRQVQRTTAAHSTVVVDNTNSAMLLPPTGLKVAGLDLGGMALKPEVVTSRREETDGQIWLDLSHDGYEESFGLVHRRRLYLSADGHDFMGEDHLIGKGGNSFALRFHLHPLVQATVTQNGQAALIKLPGGSGWRMRVQGGDLTLAEGIHIGVGGQVRRTQQLMVMGTIESNQTELKWLIQRESGKK